MYKNEDITQIFDRLGLYLKCYCQMLCYVLSADFYYVIFDSDSKHFYNYRFITQIFIGCLRITMYVQLFMLKLY